MDIIYQIYPKVNTYITLKRVKIDCLHKMWYNIMYIRGRVPFVFKIQLNFFGGMQDETEK